MRSFSICAALAILALTTAPALALAQARTPPPNRGDSPGGETILQPPVTGEQVYRQVCQACHMANAKGGSGAATIPALADNPRLASAAYPITLVVKGRGAMPGFTDLLSPAQVANVVSYVRTHFGNHYPNSISEADVTKVEGATPAR